MFEYLTNNQIASFWRMLSELQQKEYYLLLQVELKLLTDALITAPSGKDPVDYYARMTALQSHHAKLTYYLKKLTEITAESPVALPIN